MMNPSVMNLQHRFVLELSVRLPFDQRQAPWRSLIILAAATSIISAILPITSAEPALFGVYVDDILLRWRDRLGHFDLCRVDLVFRTSQAYLLARLPLYCSAECAAPSNTSLLANFRGIWPMPFSLVNHSAIALFAQRTRVPTSSRSIGFCAI